MHKILNKNGNTMQKEASNAFADAMEEAKETGQVFNIERSTGGQDGISLVLQSQPLYTD